MNIFKLAVELFVLYLLYKLVFDFIIPIYRTTKQMSGKMRDMQEKMNQQHQQQQQAQAFQETTRQQASSKKSSDDYIDYEEIK
ncbi:hypothetical protein [Ferruginibacter sp. HRS2-29]|uniref:hypothetical protein n=1 Tax=Ferruginibacter sp. HRS2-29 TaxID=2487334 RepID=UPI0020CCD419|nr:hypothetical protein [Ferruginibacter sp. HRS2-29]MCP9751241.1 hypothetical protein [Ferruginibacter sp. HRS2-29]